tara:strand:- start:1246 stop:1644 length:399 start_codon:yes stop_codon:yes gene_type:complete
MTTRARIVTFCRSALQSAILLGVSMVSMAAEPQNREPASSMPAGKIELDETVISGNQELPKVLYIVPWQQPDGLPEIELRTDFAEVELFRRLYPPAYRRELAYFEAATATAPAGVQGPAEPGRESKASDSKE